MGNIFLSLLKAEKPLYFLCITMHDYMVSCILLFGLFFVAVHNPIRSGTHFWVTALQLRTNKVVGIEHSGSHKCCSETQRQWIKERLSQRSIQAKVSCMFHSTAVVPPRHPAPLHISMSDWCVQFSDTMVVVISQTWGLLRFEIASAVVVTGLTQLFIMWEVRDVKSLISLGLANALSLLSVSWRQDGQKLPMAWGRDATESDKTTPDI